MVCYLIVDEQTKEVKTPRLRALFELRCAQVARRGTMSGAWIPGVTAVLHPSSHSPCPKVGGLWELSFEKLKSLGSQVGEGKWQPRQNCRNRL